VTTPQQPETFESTERAGSSAHNVDAPGAASCRTDAPSATERTVTSAQNVDTAQATGPSADAVEATEHTGASAATSQGAHSSTAGAESSAAGTGTSSDGSLFAGHEVSGLLSRWAEVQAGFVDDPRKCVQHADALVADVVNQLTAGFAEARSRLEEQWARGEEVSTENLRVTLKRYRDFFERLLAV
jgi:hypothetical protein